MPLQLKAVPPQRGAVWVRDAWRLFGRRPLAFSGLLFVFLFAALLTAFVPLLGAWLQMAMLPLLSLGFMVGASSALQGGNVQPGHFVEPFTGDAARRRALLQLCALYGAAAIGLLWLSNAVSDGQLAELQRLMASGAGQNNPQEVDALLADRSVLSGTLTLIIGVTLLSIPFWHAPALVHWGGQSVAQALFSSTLAVWRAKGAFVVYGLAWIGLTVVFGVVAALLLGLLGVPQMGALLALPAGLVFSTVFYVSLVFTFNDSFGTARDQDDPPRSSEVPLN